MYLCYIDESGMGKQNECFVLCTLLISQWDWADLEKKISEFKVQYFPDPSLSLKNLRIGRDTCFHNPKTRNKLYSEFYDAINELSYTLIVVVISREALRKRYTLPPDPYKLAYIFLLERIDFFVSV